MPVYRVHKNTNYSTIHNGFLEREDLSWKAKGILAYLLKLPDDWELHFNELKRNATDGKSSLRTGINELREAGYIIYNRFKDKEGKFKHEYNIYEVPQTENPDTENPELDNPDTENRDILLSTNELNTNKLNTNKTNKSSNSCSDSKNSSPNPTSDKPKFDKESTPYKAAVHLRKLILKNNPREPVPEKNPNDLEDWAIELDRLNRLGPVGAKNKGYSWEEIGKIMEWCQDDSFWKKNIKSAGKFRKQITRLEDNMKEENNSNSDRITRELLEEFREEEEEVIDVGDIQ